MHEFLFYQFTSSLQIDHWLDFSNANLKNGNSIWNAVQYLDNVLAPSTYLVGHSFTIADFAVWGALQGLFTIH